MAGNSSSPILAQIIKSETANLELLTGITKSANSNKESEDIVIGGETVKIPSFGYLKSEIERINKNIDLLSGWNGQGEISMKNSLGEIRTIYSIDGSLQPDKIGQVESPKNFTWKPNWFFESFLNPLLNIKIDITNLTEPSIGSVQVKRIIVESNEFNNNWFDYNYLGKSGIDYVALALEMNENSIRWSIDDEVLQINPLELNLWGSFSVVNWVDSTEGKNYVLNTIQYNNEKGEKINLNSGDILISGKSSKWKVVNVDSSANSVRLSKLSGWEPITIGTDTLKLWNNVETKRILEIPLGYNEREFIFLKGINKNTGIISNEWSKGFAFFSNTLVDNLTGETLDSYYKKYVTDYSQFFLSISKEKTITAIFGLEPVAPTLSTSNFSVVKINDHKYTKDEEDNIMKKSQQRYLLNSEISQLDLLIAQKKEELGTKKYEGNERNKVKKELESLINTKISKSNQYNSLSKELITIGKNSPIMEKSKYRIRGFWGMPTPRVDNNNDQQEVIQFLISYRYLRKDGSSGGSKELGFLDANGEKKRGFFSEWIEVKSDIRKKEYIPALGVYKWQNEDPTNPEKININQLDISISANESVEIKIKSISEAGWPVNPLHSKWSESITVEFPESLNSDNSWDSSVQSALDDENRIKFNEELSARNLDLHLEDSYIQNEKYWAHDATSLSSGFVKDGVIISLYDKLAAIDLELNRLRELVTRAKGALQVWIIDSDGNKIPISNNSTVNVFGGYYKEETASFAFEDQKGAIINKVFYLGLKNSAASTLELISLYPGAQDEVLPDIDLLPITDPYQKYAYDKAPIGLSGYQTLVSLNYKDQPLPWQSKQGVGQFVFFRKKDNGLKNDIYKSPQPGDDFWIEPTTPVNDPTGPAFVWAGGLAQPGNLTEFSIHTSHPAVATGLTFAQLNDPYVSGYPLYPEFRHSQYFNLESSNANGNVQLEYTDTNVSIRGKYPAKIGFTTNDRYLIGKNTCGSYFYPAIITRNDLLVNGTDSLSSLKIEFGDENEVKVPLVYQYRMEDYFGSSTTINEGKIGGWNTLNIYPSNILYRKKLGFDIKVSGENLFSFDVEVTAKFKRDTISELATNKVSIATLGNTAFNIGAS